MKTRALDQYIFDCAACGQWWELETDEGCVSSVLTHHSSECAPCVFTRTGSSLPNKVKLICAIFDVSSNWCKLKDERIRKVWKSFKRVVAILSFLDTWWGRGFCSLSLSQPFLWVAMPMSSYTYYLILFSWLTYKGGKIIFIFYIGETPLKGFVHL